MTRFPSHIGQSLAVYRDPRVVAILFLGFASGLPLALTTGTLAIWMARAGVDKTTIGLFALVGVPYALKFLWAPLVDRMRLPFLTARLGRRRGWAVFTQGMLMASLLALGASHPVSTPWLTAFLAMAVAFCSASQDIVVDAYRIDILTERQQGAGAAVTQAGYRLGLLASGAGALFLADHLSWPTVYAIMALLMTVGVGAILLSPEPHGEKPPLPLFPRRERWRAWWREAVLAPFTDFLQRPGAFTILAFVLLYKFGDVFAGVMANPFYVDIGFTNSEIASISKLFGLLATLAGVFIGGAVVSRYGVLKSLLGCGVLQMASNLMFSVQAVVGHDLSLLAVTIGFENLAGGMGSAAFVAYLSLLCTTAYSATQYALLSSLMAVGRTVLSSGAGWVAEQVDWSVFFLLSTVAALPGLASGIRKRNRGVWGEASLPPHPSIPFSYSWSGRRSVSGV
ncbi:MAG: MFS transporter PAT family beta-lactamase induction signal transducer AmpG [Rhodospirillaceae bacterium]|nr:MAG: MFS transporter PAT family beta-lactamase induction signal transducer AmpG [Rhodospirillaceae bacterium]